MEEPTVMKTAVDIPMELWDLARQRVTEEKKKGIRKPMNLRKLLVEGLDLRLKKRIGWKPEKEWL